MLTSTRAIPTTPAGFLAWESRQRRRYELVGGVVRAMTGGTVGHNLLAGRVRTALPTRLGSGCTAHQGDLKVSSPARMVTCPDVPARCGPFCRQHAA